MSVPELTQIQSILPAYSINLTYVITVAVFCVTTMATIINLFGARRSERMAQYKKDKENDEKNKIENLPGNTIHCQQHSKNLERIENLTVDNKKNVSDVTNIINEMKIQIATLEKDNSNINKSIDEIKDHNKEVAKKLDDLLRQLLEWMNN